jgi:hypothetical protein
VRIPPLRERRGDVPALIDHFVARFSRRMGKPVERVEPRTLELLMRYDWPGNVRELENVIERAVIVSRGEVLEVDPTWLSGPPTTDGRGPLAEVERQTILDALGRCGGRIYGPGGAAAALGLKPTTLYGKMRKHKIRKQPGDAPRVIARVRRAGHKPPLAEGTSLSAPVTVAAAADDAADPRAAAVDQVAELTQAPVDQRRNDEAQERVQEPASTFFISVADTSRSPSWIVPQLLTPPQCFGDRGNATRPPLVSIRPAQRRRRVHAEQLRFAVKKSSYELRFGPLGDRRRCRAGRRVARFPCPSRSTAAG